MRRLRLRDRGRHQRRHDSVAGRHSNAVGVTGPDAADKLDSLRATLYCSFVNPGRLFASMRPEAPVRQALLYGLAVGSVAAVLSMMSMALFPTSVPSLLADDSGRAGTVALIFAPLSIIIQFLLASFYAHAMLKISRSKPKRFPATFKIVLLFRRRRAAPVHPLHRPLMLDYRMALYPFRRYPRRAPDHAAPRAHGVAAAGARGFHATAAGIIVIAGVAAILYGASSPTTCSIFSADSQSLAAHASP